MTVPPVLNPGRISGHHFTASGLEAQTEHARLRVTYFTDHVVNVRWTRHAGYDERTYAVVAEPAPDLQSGSMSATELLMTGSKIVTRISLADGLIRFTDAGGRVLNADESGLGVSWIGEQVTCYKHLQPGERFIGLGEKVGPLDRRGRGYVHYNTDAFAYGSGTDPIYSSIPFYIGVHQGMVYGIFFDNSCKTYFNFGASNDRFASFAADQGEMNYYFLHGDSVAEIISAYAGLTGTMPLPPQWSIGYQQCRYSYYPEREVTDLARQFRERRIPADTIVLDIHYMDAYKIFTWDRKHFPDPARMVASLREQGFHVVVMCDPGIKKEPGYAPFDEGLRKDLFLKYPDGQPYTGQVWPGWCHFPDFTKEQARQAWGDWMQHYTDLGVDGFWNDMNEFSTWGQTMPENIIFDLDGQPGTSRAGRNVYGIQMAKSTYEGAKRHLKGKRPFNLTRSGYAGIQRYAALWTGDNVSYDEHMLLGVRLVNSLGLCGVAFAGYDIGGFVGDASPGLYARWISIGVFSPFCRTHTMINSRDSEPWSYGEEVEIIARNYLRFRYQLMPYLYSVFREAAETGMPVQRSLAIKHPHCPEVYESLFENQYLFGPDILVAPAESHRDIVKVWFPVGEWYHLHDGTLFGGNRIAAVDAPVHRLPVFVRAGAVIPLQDPVEHTGQPSETVHLHAYHGGAGTSFQWYADDGETYAFENGDYCLRRIDFDGTRLLVVGQAEGSFVPRYQRMRVVMHGFPEGTRISVDGVSTDVTVEDESFFEPMVKFDPLGDAPDVGSETVGHFTIPHHAGRIEISFS